MATENWNALCLGILLSGKLQAAMPTFFIVSFEAKAENNEDG